MPMTSAKTPRLRTAASPARPISSAGNPEAMQQEIRKRARQIYQKRNGGPGDALTDWLQAEREVKAQYQSSYQ
jgi:hypothetical protein